MRLHCLDLDFALSFAYAFVFALANLLEVVNCFCKRIMCHLIQINQLSEALVHSEESKALDYKT